MRIAVLTYSLAGIGGTPKHTLCVADALVAMGHQVTVWSVEGSKDRCYPELTEGLDVKTLRPARHPAGAEMEKPPLIRMLAHLLELWRYYQDQRRLFLAMPGGYDVVNTIGLLTNWAAAAYKRRYGTPVVWMANDFWPIGSYRYESVSSTWGKIKKSVKETLCFPFVRYDEAAVCAIDKIVVLSERVRCQMMEHYGVSPAIARAGVDFSRFACGNGQQIRARYLDHDGSFLLLTVCQLVPYRRLEDVVRAVRILAEEGLRVIYLIVGRTLRPDYAQFIQAEASACNVGHRIIFTGEVSEEELVACYHACDAFIWASDESQTWGLAGMEAMAAGKPVIVSEANGLAEVLEHGKTALLVAPRSPKEIADAVTRLIREPDVAKSVADEGQRLVRERYSWTRHAEEMLTPFYRAADRY